jgi:hypothetical protein
MRSLEWLAQELPQPRLQRPRRSSLATAPVFAPETPQPKRNERDRNQPKLQRSERRLPRRSPSGEGRLFRRAQRPGRPPIISGKTAARSAPAPLPTKISKTTPCKVEKAAAGEDAGDTVPFDTSGKSAALFHHCSASAATDYRSTFDLATVSPLDRKFAALSEDKADSLMRCDDRTSRLLRDRKCIINFDAEATSRAKRRRDRPG